MVKVTGTGESVPEHCEKDPWIPLCAPQGYDQGYVRASQVIHVAVTPNPTLTWIDYKGERQSSYLPYGSDHTKYLGLLGIPQS